MQRVGHRGRIMPTRERLILQPRGKLSRTAINYLHLQTCNNNNSWNAPPNHNPVKKRGKLTRENHRLSANAWKVRENQRESLHPWSAFLGCSSNHQTHHDRHVLRRVKLIRLQLATKKTRGRQERLPLTPTKIYSV